MVDSFCHLGGMLPGGEICELAVTACVKTAWKEFKELLPVLISHEARGHVYRGPCYMPMKPWTLTKTSLQRNDRVMIRQSSRELPTWVAWGDLYADDLVFTANVSGGSCYGRKPQRRMG